MLKSMTGYGQATQENEQLRVSVEVKAINSKNADVSLRLPRSLAAQELAYRNQVITFLGRGKITLTVSYDLHQAQSSTINVGHFKAYYSMLKNLAEEVGTTSTALFQLALQGPEVIIPADLSAGTEAVMPLLEQVMQAALMQCDQGRKQEGAALAKQISTCIHNIRKGLNQVEKLAPARAKATREKLRADVEALTKEVDESRLAQELIYYLERIDITEEQVRLGQHLLYFEEVMQSTQPAGKKLGFIAQEIGREINTIGAKANDTAIQQEVIYMKDELEKIKEQLQNIL